MKQHLRRVVAAAVTAGTLAGALTGLSPARADDPDELPVPTVTAAGPATRLLSYNSLASSSFTVTVDGVPYARKTVKICTGPVGGAMTCANAATTTGGKVQVSQRSVKVPTAMNVVVPATATNAGTTSDSVVHRPQVTVAVKRKSTTMTVTLNAAANQYLVVKRLDGTRWLVDRILTVTQASTVVTDLVVGTRYQVTVSDTPTIRGNVSAAV